MNAGLEDKTKYSKSRADRGGIYPPRTSTGIFWRDKIAHMRWIITERWVLRKANLYRYCDSKKDEKLGSEERGTVQAMRRVWGIERPVFTEQLERYFEYLPMSIMGLPKMVRHIYFWTMQRIYPYRHASHIAVVNDILENAEMEGFIYPFDHLNNEVDRFRLTKKGRRYISRLYYWKRFYNSKPFQLILTVLIQFGIPALLVWGSTHFFNISITPK